MVAAAKHLEALHKSSVLTEWLRRMYREGAAVIKPEKVIRVLKEAGVRFVVMGAHGINGYRTQARATEDVDILVAKRDHRKAVIAIEVAYPKLEVRDTPIVTRFADPATEEVVIDLMKPNVPLYKLIFKNCVAVGDAYRIPNLEMALAAKFASMISPVRSPDKKHTDAGDFINVVQKNHEELDLGKLSKLAELVYKGGGMEIIEYVENVKAGRTIRV